MDSLDWTIYGHSDGQKDDDQEDDPQLRPGGAPGFTPFLANQHTKDGSSVCSEPL